jgi:hypothetical protein
MAQLIALGNNKTLVKFRLQLQVPAPKNRWMLFVLDRSGSMRHDPIALAKKLAVEMNKQAFDLGYEGTVVVCFDDKVESGRFTTIAETENYLRTIDARGGTSFTQAIDATIGALADLKSANISMLFLTDGQNGDKDKTAVYTRSIPQLLAELMQNKNNLSARIVGLGNGVDAKFLANMTNLSEDASVVIAKNAPDLADKTAELMDLLQSIPPQEIEVEVMGQLIRVQARPDAAGNAEVRLALEANAPVEELVWRLVADFDNDPKDEEKKEDNLVAVVPCEDRAENIPYVLEYMQNRFRQLTGLVVANPANAHLYNDEVQELRDMLQPLLKDTANLHRDSRKELRSAIMATLNMANDVVAMVATAVRTKMVANNVGLAALSAVNHSNLKSGLSRKLDEAAVKNEKRYEKDSAALALIVAPSEERLAEIESTLGVLKDARCCFCFTDPLDALDENKFLGVGCRSSRPYAAIADPTQWVLHEIYQNLENIICNECFFDAVKRALATNPDGFIQVGRHDPKHDDKALAGVMLQGQPFNAIIPLVYCRESLELVRLLDKPILGLQVAGSGLAFMPSQRLAVYGLAHWRSTQQLVEEKSEINTEFNKLIADTAEQMLNLTQADILKEAQETLGVYADSADQRTVDKISNNPLLLIMAQITHSELNAVQRSLMTEEEMRRRLKSSALVKVGTMLTSQVVMQLIGLELEPWIEPYLAAYKHKYFPVLGENPEKVMSVLLEKWFALPENRTFADRMGWQLRASAIDEADSEELLAEEKKEDMAVPDPDTDYDGSLLKISPRMQPYTDAVKAVFNEVVQQLVLPGLQLCGQPLDAPRTVEEFGLDTHEKLFAFTWQLVNQTENSERRLQSKKWQAFHLLENGAAKSFIHQLFAKRVNAERAAGKVRVNKAETARKNANGAELFAAAESLCATLAVIRSDAYQVHSSDNIAYYMQALCNPVAALPFEKLLLLTIGKVTSEDGSAKATLADEIKNWWIPRSDTKKNCRTHGTHRSGNRNWCFQFWQAHHDKKTIAEWKEFFAILELHRVVYLALQLINRDLTPDQRDMYHANISAVDRDQLLTSVGQALAQEKVPEIPKEDLAKILEPIMASLEANKPIVQEHVCDLMYWIINHQSYKKFHIGWYKTSSLEEVRDEYYDYLAKPDGL